MAVDFALDIHHITGGVVVEVLVDGEVAAVIYPEKDKGIKIVSAHIQKIVEDSGTKEVPPIPSVLVTFDPKPYSIVHGRLVRR